ncbi:MAG: Glu/Leu/Phe/Val dehydrogenase [Candidatus Doudnabacteria bacterium]|nr:Glu/Leu/Phe/Val dehydrogenase [Candidatus Doudnabacteria bacterium]
MDKFGPEYILEVYDPRVGMQGFLVIDNTVLGAGKGGIRMTPDVSVEEVARLARTMTWKNALAGIPFGGAKAGIIWRGGSDRLKKQFIQSFARAVKLFTPKKYIAGPDVNTGEREMQWFVEATNDWRSATGKPANLCMKIFGKPGERCGIPHEFGSTGFGVAVATRIAARMAGVDLSGARLAIHGFGNVGTFTYQYLSGLGAKVVALADRKYTVYSPAGLKKTDALDKYPKKFRIKPEDFWQLDADILIPASVTDVINKSNKNKIKAKIIVEAGNIPMTEEIEKELHKKGILVVPDFVANAGGVISSYAEYRGYNPKRMLELVEKKIKSSTTMVLKRALRQKKNPRAVALKLAQEKITAARRLIPF